MAVLAQLIGGLVLVGLFVFGVVGVVNYLKNKQEIPAKRQNKVRK